MSDPMTPTPPPPAPSPPPTKQVTIANDQITLG